jgi:hypothetical protein
LNKNTKYQQIKKRTQKYKEKINCKGKDSMEREDNIEKNKNPISNRNRK